MRLNRRFSPWKVASKDITRQHLTHCYLDVEKQKLVATNGNAMAVVPVDELSQSPGPCPNDESGFVSVAALEQAKKLTPKSLDGVILSANGQHVFLGGATMPRAKAEPLEFPPWERVVPSYRRGSAGTVTIGVDPTMLATLAKAIGEERAVSLTFPSPSSCPNCDHYSEQLGHVEMLDPIRVEGSSGEAFGLLMPVRL